MYGAPLRIIEAQALDYMAGCIAGKATDTDKTTVLGPGFYEGDESIYGKCCGIIHNLFSQYVKRGVYFLYLKKLEHLTEPVLQSRIKAEEFGRSGLIFKNMDGDIELRDMREIVNEVFPKIETAISVLRAKTRKAWDESLDAEEISKEARIECLNAIIPELERIMYECTSTIIPELKNIKDIKKVRNFKDKWLVSYETWDGSSAESLIKIGEKPLVISGVKNIETFMDFGRRKYMMSYKTDEDAYALDLIKFEDMRVTERVNLLRDLDKPVEFERIDFQQMAQYKIMKRNSDPACVESKEWRDFVDNARGSILKIYFTDRGGNERMTTGNKLIKSAKLRERAYSA
jgi:hypothetical protein